MKAKEYLQQVRLKNARVKSRLSILDEVRERLTSIGSLDYAKDKVITSPINSIEERIIKYIDLQNEIGSEWDDYLDFRDTVAKQIAQLDNPAHIELLTKYYLECKPLWKSAQEMNYSYDHIKRMHGQALWAFELKFFKDATK